MCNVQRATPVRRSAKRQGGCFAILLVLLAAIAPAASTTRGPDGGGYTGTDLAVYSFIDISTSGGAAVLGGTDDGTAALVLPFAFRFYGQFYGMVCVSSNGAVYFIGDQSECAGINDFANTDPTSTAVPGDRPALHPLWSDLKFDGLGAGVYYQTVGAPGSRQFVMQWNNAYPLGSQNAVTFQAILSEGSHQVLFQYKTVGLGSGNPASNGGEGTIGIRNTGAPGNGQQIAWSHKAPVLADGTALLFIGSRLTPTVTATGGTFTYTGSPKAGSGSASGAGGPGDVLNPPVTLSYAGTGSTSYGPTTAAPTLVGSYEITATFAGNGSYAGGTATASLVIERATPTITFATAPSPTYPGGNFTVSASTTNTDSSTLTYSVVSGPCSLVSGATFSSSGTGACVVKAAGAASANFNAAEATRSITITSASTGYTVQGFLDPVAMPNGAIVWNDASAGQGIPLKWRLTRNGVPVTDPASFTGLVSNQVSCTSGGSAVDISDEPATGNSGLQNEGNGEWQYNWKTAKTYRNTCRVVYVRFSDGTVSGNAYFRFK